MKIFKECRCWIKHFALIIAGLLLIIPAIVLGPFAKLLPIDVNRPWVDGVLINTLRAYKKYNTRSWLRRITAVLLHPNVVIEYLKLLTNKQCVVLVSSNATLPVNQLTGSHWVQTSHVHHRRRVENMNSHILATAPSTFGQIVVVDNVVHDGNHRLAASQEAGVMYLADIKHYKSQ